MPATYSTPDDYRAAIESATYYRVPKPGYVLFSGQTRYEYIQRQTTNDIGRLTPNRALPTLLTAPTGRILESYTLLDIGAIAMLTQPGHGEGNAAYFQKRVFFNDNVTIQDQSSQWAHIELLGPRVSELLARFDLPATGAIHEAIATTWNDANLTMYREADLVDQPRFRIVLPYSMADRFIESLGNTAELSFTSSEILRIESILAGDPEFAAETTPFELGLDDLVSTTKGCYTGQEVLARQVTYDKVVRRLVLLSSDQPMQAKMAISAEGKTVGQVTSTANSPWIGHIALGIVRKPYDEAETKLTLKVGKTESSAVVT